MLSNATLFFIASGPSQPVKTLFTSPWNMALMLINMQFELFIFSHGSHRTVTLIIHTMISAASSFTWQVKPATCNVSNTCKQPLHWIVFWVCSHTAIEFYGRRGGHEICSHSNKTMKWRRNTAVAQYIRNASNRAGLLVLNDFLHKMWIISWQNCLCGKHN